MPFNSASDAFQLHPDIALYGTTLRGTVNGVRRVAYVIGCLLAFQFAVPLQQPLNAVLSLIHI